MRIERCHSRACALVPIYSLQHKHYKGGQSTGADIDGDTNVTYLAECSGRREL